MLPVASQRNLADHILKLASFDKESISDGHSYRKYSKAREDGSSSLNSDIPQSDQGLQQRLG